MKSVKYFIYMAFAVTATLAACGKSSNNGTVTASVPNNCTTRQGYSSTAGCLTLTNTSQCGVQTGQVMGISSAGQCAVVECVNNGSSCVAVSSSGYYNNGSYVNGSYINSGYGYGNSVIYGNGYPVYGTSVSSVYGGSFYPQQPSYGYGYGYPYNGYGGGYSSGSYISGGIYFHSGY